MMGLGFDALILTTVGAKSGTERTNPVGCFPGKDGSWLIVASVGGAARNPAWYHNIAAHPRAGPRLRCPARRAAGGSGRSSPAATLGQSGRPQHNPAARPC
jgi:deazaflavin-dependent oxidoreductase (nitroreductase family)